MIQLISCPTWKFTDRVATWVNQLTEDYDVYDCKIVSYYDHETGNDCITAIFLYKKIEAIKVEFEGPTREIRLEKEIKREADKTDEDYIEFLKRYSKNRVLNVKSSPINIESNSTHNEFLSAIADLLENEEDRSEPYARGKMCR